MHVNEHSQTIQAPHHQTWLCNCSALKSRVVADYPCCEMQSKEVAGDGYRDTEAGWH